MKSVYKPHPGVLHVKSVYKPRLIHRKLRYICRPTIDEMYSYSESSVLKYDNGSLEYMYIINVFLWKNKVFGAKWAF